MAGQLLPLTQFISKFSISGSRPNVTSSRRFTRSKAQESQIIHHESATQVILVPD